MFLVDPLMHLLAAGALIIMMAPKLHAYLRAPSIEDALYGYLAQLCQP